MSRFKLFSLVTAMIASISNNASLSSKEKSKQINSISLNNSYGNPFGGKRLNQRQIRKRRRQNPNAKKWAA